MIEIMVEAGFNRTDGIDYAYSVGTVYWILQAREKPLNWNLSVNFIQPANISKLYHDVDNFAYSIDWMC